MRTCEQKDTNDSTSKKSDDGAGGAGKGGAHAIRIFAVSFAFPVKVRYRHPKIHLTVPGSLERVT
jgi:hypothetical protein